MSEAKSVTLALNSEEAKLVVEGLRTLLNCRRFAPKEPDEDTRQLHAEYYAVLEKVQAQLAAATG